MDDLPKQLASRFALLRKVGEGTFAEVYRARDLRSGNEVALKILRAPLRRDVEARERFRREAIALAAINSPHVIALEASTTDDTDFIAMEYASGPRLRDYLCGSPLDPAQVHALVGQIAQAVAAIHAASVMHRDLKPENVLLVGDGDGMVVKLIDFGLAKLPLLESDLQLDALTAQGTSFGTPPYMAPEYMSGTAAASPMGDLWATSVIAYELVTGRLPWIMHDPREIYFAITTGAVPSVGGTSSAQLDAFFGDALAVDPRRRPSTAEQLFTRFEQSLYGGPLATTDVFAGVTNATLDLRVASSNDLDTQPGAVLR